MAYFIMFFILSWICFAFRPIGWVARKSRQSPKLGVRLDRICSAKNDARQSSSSAVNLVLLRGVPLAVEEAAAAGGGGGDGGGGGCFSLVVCERSLSMLQKASAASREPVMAR